MRTHAFWHATYCVALVPLAGWHTRYLWHALAAQFWGLVRLPCLVPPAQTVSMVLGPGWVGVWGSSSMDSQCGPGAYVWYHVRCLYFALSVQSWGLGREGHRVPLASTQSEWSWSAGSWIPCWEAQEVSLAGGHCGHLGTCNKVVHHSLHGHGCGPLRVMAVKCLTERFQDGVRGQSGCWCGCFSLQDGMVSMPEPYLAWEFL